MEAVNSRTVEEAAHAVLRVLTKKPSEEGFMVSCES